MYKIPSETLIVILPEFFPHWKIRSIYRLCCTVVRAKLRYCREDQEYRRWYALSTLLRDWYPKVYEAAYYDTLAIRIV
jgi:hypothetical protein